MKSYSKYILVLSLIILSSSCSKWLDQEPQDGIIKENFWKSREQVESAVIGCYSSLLGAPDGITDRPLAEYFFLWGELRADLIAPAIGITTEEQDVINVNVLETNSITKWNAVYRTINNCNTVLDFAPQVLKTDNTLTQEALNSYLAEALALRSLMYFYLVRSFGEVPLQLVSTSTDEDINPIAKSSSTVILNQIVTDLKTAEDMSALTYGTKQYDTGRITRYTVETILADVYLWMDNYQGVIDQCDKVIISKKFSLVPGNSSWFNQVYYTGNSQEGIFEFQYDAQKLNTFYPMFATSRKRFVASAKVIEDIYTLNYDDETIKDIRGGDAALKVSDNSIWKYIGYYGSASRTASDSYAHWFVYRYADVLLMKAEACSQIGRGAEALELVKTIRERAHALVATERNPDPSDADGIAEYIMDERAREFAFEGKRWYDILRNAKRNNYKREDLLLDIVSQTVSPDRQQSAIAKYKDHNSHYFPINLSELQTNSLLAQNPFYR